MLCLGAAYKPGVADVRESPVIEVMRQLQRKGATVSYAHPFVPDLLIDIDRLAAVELTAETLAAVDAVVVLTPHAGFDLELVRRSAPSCSTPAPRCRPGRNVFRL